MYKVESLQNKLIKHVYIYKKFYKIYLIIIKIVKITKIFFKLRTKIFNKKTIKFWNIIQFLNEKSTCLENKLILEIIF